MWSCIRSDVPSSQPWDCIIWTDVSTSFLSSENTLNGTEGKLYSGCSTGPHYSAYLSVESSRVGDYVWNTCFGGWQQEREVTVSEVPLNYIMKYQNILLFWKTNNEKCFKLPFGQTIKEHVIYSNSKRCGMLCWSDRPRRDSGMADRLIVIKILSVFAPRIRY